MGLFISKLFSSVLEIIVFAFVPFVWWLITARKKESFTKWIGLKGIDKKECGKVVKWSLLTSLCFAGLSIFMLNVVKGVEGLATSDFTGLGLKALPTIIIYAVFNTAFPEEILFRGFLLKRLSNKFGFGVANFIQCVVFGMIHGLMFVKYTGFVTGVSITVFTMAIACCMGYINEKKAAGSLLPSWGIHAAANIFSGLFSAFI